MHTRTVSEICILDEKILPPLQGTTLFYPCSGYDLFVPIQLFSPFVSDYWFIDRGYFSPGHQDTRYFQFDAPADQQKPLLLGYNNYEWQESKITGPASWTPYEMDIEPCVLSETYRHVTSGNLIRVHRRRGYGFSAFNKEIARKRCRLGVFFYRGDSEGEGGSGNIWLTPERIEAICEKLVDGGFIVTDGCQHGWFIEHQELWKNHRTYRRELTPSNPRELIKSYESFEDKKGNRFTCVGYAGHRYGPTMIWQVKKRLY